MRCRTSSAASRRATSQRPAASASRRAASWTATACCAQTSSLSSWAASSSTSSNYGLLRSSFPAPRRAQPSPAGSATPWMLAIRTTIFSPFPTCLIIAMASSCSTTAWSTLRRSSGRPCPRPRTCPNPHLQSSMFINPGTWCLTPCMLSPNHFDLLIMPEISFMEECEEFEWPPSTLILPVFSSKIGSWEKRTFYRDGEAAGTVPGLVGVRLDCNERQSAYWRGSLYICCDNCFILRISLSDNSYRVIRLPTRLPEDDSKCDQQFYLGKSTKGIYCASRVTSHRSHLQVWFLNDPNEWVLKHDKDIFPVLPSLDYGNPCDGPRILQQFDEHSDEDDSVVEENREAVEMEKFEAIVKQGKFEWDSENDNVLEPGSSCGGTDTCFHGFHPFKEVVSFVTLWDRVLAYHLPSSKLQDLGKLFPEFYVDRHHTYWHTQVEESFLHRLKSQEK
ncbi:hypothetical protein VPH35_056389 [Triticum aestivum]